MKVRRFLLAIALLVASLLVVLPALAFQQVQIYVNGSRVHSDVLPRIIDGRTMVPLRFVAEALGCQVRWDPATNSVYVEGGNISNNEPEPGPPELKSNIVIEGSDEFVKLVNEALELLRNKAPEYYVFACKYAKKIKQGYPPYDPNLPAWENKKRGAFPAYVGWDKESGHYVVIHEMGSPEWTANLIVHEAGHIWVDENELYNQPSWTYEEEEEYCGKLGDSAYFILTNQRKRGDPQLTLPPPVNYPDCYKKQ
jgi:hypothetical protein